MKLFFFLVLSLAFVGSVQADEDRHSKPDENNSSTTADSTRPLGSGVNFATGFEEWKLHDTSPDKWNEFVGKWEEPNLYFDNNDAYDLRIKLLDNAPKGSVAKILSFVFDIGKTTKKLAAHMCLAAQRGVEVRFMVDSKSGSIPGKPNIFDKEEAEEIFQYLANCGVRVRIFNHISDFYTTWGGKAWPGKKLLKDSLKDPVHSPLNRLNHRKLFWIENAKDSKGDKNACMLLGGRNLGDHYLHWDGKGDSWFDGDAFICRHMFKGENENSKRALDQASDSFNALWTDSKITFDVNPNPDFKYKHIWFQMSDSFHGVEFSRPEKETSDVLHSGGYMDKEHIRRTPLEKRDENFNKTLEENRMPVAMPVQAPFQKTPGHRLLDTENWRVATSTWDPKKDQVRQELYDAIDREQCEIFIETPYSEMDETMAGKIEAALKRGVNVTLVTNGLFTSDGASWRIRLYEGRFVKNLLDEYGARDSSGKPVALNKRDEHPELKAKGRFWYYNTTIYANHMIHYKGAGFKCQKYDDKDGKANYKKRFILGSHNFHARSGLSDQEHAVVWEEPVDKSGLASVARGKFTEREVLELTEPIQKECTEKVFKKLKEETSLTGDAFLKALDQRLRICVHESIENALAKLGRRYFSDKELTKIDAKYNLGPEGSLLDLKKAHRDMVDRRIDFYSKLSVPYKNVQKPLLLPYQSIAEEIDKALGHEATVEKLSNYEYWRTRLLRRVIYTDASGKPEVRRSVYKAIDMLRPLFNYTSLFF